jgi:hypothetical protein
MRKYQSYGLGGHLKFFRMTLGYDELKNYYSTNFSLMQHHKYSLTELDNLIPWEKQIYVRMLTNHINEQNEKIKLMQAQKNR